MRPRLHAWPPAAFGLLTCLGSLPASLARAQQAGVLPPQDALHPAGIQAGEIGSLWNLTLALCTIVFIAIVVATAIAVRRAAAAARAAHAANRSRASHGLIASRAALSQESAGASATSGGDAPLPADLRSLDRPEPVIRRNIIIATAVSTVLLIGLILADVLTDRALSRMPVKDAITINLTGHMWWWEATYTDGEPARHFTTANELHVPAGRPVIVTLGSADVIHSFWAPNLHGKKDLLPGRTSLIRFRVDHPGVYRGQCAEFCGLEHALMSFFVSADDPQQYETWANAQRQGATAPISAAEVRGQKVFMSRTCVMCHAIRGTSAGAVLGPDLTHVASRNTLASGVLPNDRGHLAAWILDPQAIKPGANMPPTRLSPNELEDLLAYLAILK